MLTEEEIAALKAENEKLKNDLKAKDDTKSKEEKDRIAKEEADKVKGKDYSEIARQKEDDDKKEKDKTAEMEKSAIFNANLNQFVKDNGPLVSPRLASVVEVANKENFANSTERARELKGAIVKEFFSVESNVKHLTDSQKARLDFFLTQTKNGRAEQITAIWDDLFEPTLELVRKIKSFEEKSSGKVKSDSGIKNKFMEVGKKSYLKTK